MEDEMDAAEASIEATIEAILSTIPPDAPSRQIVAGLPKDSRRRLAKILGAAEETVGIEHLASLLAGGTSAGGDQTIRAYVGFEPSGRAHIGWKVIATSLRRMLDADVNVLVFMADWHAWVNDKFDGDMERIQTTAKYMEEVFRCLLDHPEEGDGPGCLRFIWASELMDSGDYWARVLRCSKNMSLARVRRTFGIMGRAEDSSDGDLSRFYYPAMQAADIFELEIDIAIGGMDQRKAHMYMRDVADSWGWTKATCVHTPIVSGLKATGERMESFDHKMSKSDPQGSILLHDSQKIIRKKIKGAHLDPASDNSPVHELVEMIILPEIGVLKVRPDPKYGEPSDWRDTDAIMAALADGSLHPLDYKIAVADSLAESLQPLTDHFDANPDTLHDIERFTK